MTLFQICLLSALALCVVPGSFIWLRAKSLLRARGFPVSYSNRGHMQDLFYMKELLHSVRNPQEQAKLRRLRICMISFLTASGVLLVAFVGDFAFTLLAQS